MPTPSNQSGQSWPRGFAPLFRGPSSDQHLRVSDAERQAVADRLAEHYADGRLDQAEFDERAGRAMSAKTWADLNGLFDDLPEPMGSPGAASAGAAATAPGMPMRLRRGHRHPVLLIVLAVFVAMAVAHAVVPWLWIGFLVAVAFLVTRGVRRSHPSQDS
jgi:Domain of unknown function (DUF1707)